MLIRDILNLKGNSIYSIDPQATLLQAIALLVEYDIGSLVVMENQAMIGMTTFREILEAIHRNATGFSSMKVAEIMVPEPLSGKPEDTLDHMRSVMTENHVRYLPIMEDQKILGVLSFHDVAKAALNEVNFENRLLKRYIRDWPETS